jgi:hypothetical protein
VNLAVAKAELGPNVVARARLAAEAAERAGSDQAQAMSHLALSVAGTQNGQWDLAIAAAEEGLRVWRTKRVCGDFAAQILAAHARALLGAGARERACEASAEAIVVAQRHGQPVHDIEATLAHARCLREFRGGEASAAIEPRLWEASRLIDQTGRRTSAPAPACRTRRTPSPHRRVRRGKARVRGGAPALRGKSARRDF